MQNKKVLIVSIIVLIALFVGGGYFYKQNQASKVEKMSKEQALLFQRDHSIVIGNKDAKVQLVEFFDPACITCGQFHHYVKDILKENNGQVKLVLRYAPFHKNSNYAVKMLEGARKQGLFMETLEFMFSTQKYWIDGHVVNANKLWSYLPNVKGLDMKKLAVSMEDKSIDALIVQDLADAKSLGATKTPAYYVNGKPLQNFGLKQLQKLVKSAL